MSHKIKNTNTYTLCFNVDVSSQIKIEDSVILMPTAYDQCGAQIGGQ